MDTYHSESSTLSCRWQDLLAMCAAIALLVPFSIEISIGQDGHTNIVVQRPDDGHAPIPKIHSEVSSDSELAALATSPATSEPAASEPAASEPAASEPAASEPAASEPASSEPITNLVAPEVVRNLSVKPGTSELLPADRPAWIGASPDYTGKVHRLFVGSSPTSDPDQADRSLDEPLMAAVNEYIDQEVLHERDAADILELDAQYIRRNLINDPEGISLELTTSQGPMYQKWVTVEVTPQQRQQILNWHREAIQRNRLGPLGLGLAALVGFVGASHLVLRRKHGMPSLKPSSADQRYVSESSPPTPAPRAKTGLSLFAILFCVLVFPAMLGLMALLPAYYFVRHSPSTQTIHSRLENRVKGELKALEEISNQHGLHKSQTEERLESNGQVIIIRKSKL